MAELIQTHLLTPESIAVREIKLTQGQIALVSAEDYTRINFFKWFFHQGMQRRAARMVNRQMVYMHHEVLQITGAELRAIGKETDHINRNPLDNRRENLRIVTHAENMRNTDAADNFKGYSLHKQSGLYLTYVRFDRRNMVSLGYCRTEEKAKETVALAIELKLKFPRESMFREEWEKIRPRKKYNRSKM